VLKYIRFIYLRNAMQLGIKNSENLDAVLQTSMKRREFILNSYQITPILSISREKFSRDTKLKITQFPEKVVRATGLPQIWTVGARGGITKVVLGL
jgi:hypothetical protein